MARKPAKTTDQSVDAFVTELRRTKGGVTVTEEGGATFVRTRDGDVHRFDHAAEPIDEA
ncbi:hypothetical protein [Aureimonas frigidaquae]|uniref:Phthalate 4,5-dioxygenase oxygenase reductase subunit n=1 Tax=Aureimonas frigidaquae TaxID=424757 RepID=A0A0P0Z4H7_9HYPH|nr:hypothetical protein [Aureimonas frigidaquae]BAT28731.1 phthalate 4,5-dioxygenase oxygenase reductase subunit [Aureimonas frigidaquae]